MPYNSAALPKKGRDAMKDYRKYQMNGRECLAAAGAGGSIAYTAAATFFPNLLLRWIVMLVGGGAAVLFWKRYRCAQQQKRLRYEFREFLGMMAAVLRAGRSVEGAVAAVYEDMEEGESALMYEEARGILHGLQLQVPVEELFRELGERSGLSEIQDFAEILYVSKRSRGELTDVMEHTVQILEDKMEAEEELRVVLAKRKMEQRILTGMPFGVIAMLFVMSPEYLEPLYTYTEGRIVMAVCAGLMAVSLWMAGRIMRVQI